MKSDLLECPVRSCLVLSLRFQNGSPQYCKSKCVCCPFAGSFDTCTSLHSRLTGYAVLRPGPCKTQQHQVEVVGCHLNTELHSPLPYPVISGKAREQFWKSLIERDDLIHDVVTRDVRGGRLPRHDVLMRRSQICHVARAAVVHHVVTCDVVAGLAIS